MALGVALGVVLGLAVGVAVEVGVAITVAAGLAVPVGVPVGESLGVGDGVGDSVGVGVGLEGTVGVGLAVAVGVKVAVGVGVGVAVGVGLVQRYSSSAVAIVVAPSYPPVAIIRPSPIVPPEGNERAVFMLTELVHMSVNGWLEPKPPASRIEPASAGATQAPDEQTRPGLHAPS